MMEYLLVVVSLFLIIVVIMTGDSNEEGFTAMSKGVITRPCCSTAWDQLCYGVWDCRHP